MAIITILVAKRLRDSTHGRAFLSVREDEVAAEAMGIDTTGYKVRAFVISAFFAGIAEQLVSGYVSSTWKDAVAFAILILILLVKPTGLLGRGQPEKV